jgi:hypothetical protein
VSYEGVVRCRPPTDRTSLLGFGDQAGPRPWPRRSCSCVRRVCPASPFRLRAVARGHSWPKTPKGREPFRFTGPFGRSLDLGSTKGRLSSNRRAWYRRNSAGSKSAHIDGRRRARSSSGASLLPSDAMFVCAAFDCPTCFGSKGFPSISQEKLITVIVFVIRTRITIHSFHSKIISRVAERRAAQPTVPSRV